MDFLQDLGQWTIPFLVVLFTIVIIRNQIKYKAFKKKEAGEAAKNKGHVHHNREDNVDEEAGEDSRESGPSPFPNVDTHANNAHSHSSGSHGAQGHGHTTPSQPGGGHGHSNPSHEAKTSHGHEPHGGHGHGHGHNSHGGHGHGHGHGHAKEPLPKKSPTFIAIVGICLGILIIGTWVYLKWGPSPIDRIGRQLRSHDYSVPR